MFTFGQIRNRPSKFRGFTLVELMVVIAIIAVLAAIIIPVYSRARESARQTKCKANLHAIAIALRTYLNDNDGFPPPYNPIAGTGGVTELYLAGYLTSKAVLVCPNDTTTLSQYITANGIDPDTYTQWKPKASGGTGEDFFAERYSSYNQLLGSGPTTTYPLYNYYGYRGYANAQVISAAPYGGGSNVDIQPAPAGTGPTGSGFEDAAYASLVPSGTEIAALMGTSTEPLVGGQYWAAAIYTDSNHAPNYDGVVFDRAATDTYARPLWDATANNTTAYFPGLINRNAPDYTIITHCPWHRDWFGGTAAWKDIVVRLGGDVGTERVSGYDWVVQKVEQAQIAAP